MDQDNHLTESKGVELELITVNFPLKTSPFFFLPNACLCLLPLF